MELPAADQELDCTGLLCPVPIIRTFKAAKKMQAGQVLKMVATDPGSIPDMEAWSRQTGHELINSSEENKVYTFYIRLTK